MKITLVTPSYNQGKFIEETIESVISQEGDFELEYIIMDGDSTDDTIEVIKKYDKLIKSKKFKSKCKKLTFKWFSEKDRGQSHAINKGFKIAKGDIINWLNSDDLLEHRTLQTISDFFKKNPLAEVVYGDGLKINETGKIIGVFKGANFTRSDLIRRWNRAYQTFFIPQPSTFVKISILKKYGYLNEKLHLGMDYDWYLRINKKNKFNYINKILSRNRYHLSCKSVRLEKEAWKVSMNLSKKYWNENYIFYEFSYYINLPLIFLYRLSALLKNNSKTYTKIVGLIKNSKSYKLIIKN